MAVKPIQVPSKVALLYTARFCGAATCYSAAYSPPTLRAVRGCSPYDNFPIEPPRPCESWKLPVPRRAGTWASSTHGQNRLCVCDAWSFRDSTVGLACRCSTIELMQTHRDVLLCGFISVSTHEIPHASFFSPCEGYSDILQATVAQNAPVTLELLHALGR